MTDVFSSTQVGNAQWNVRTATEFFVAIIGLPPASQILEISLNVSEPCAVLYPAVLVGLLGLSAWASGASTDSASAAKLTNLGVAYMNQQRMDKAVEQFDLALKADPSLTDCRA